MQELLGRLTALDSEASEGLKVISYFDALVKGHASFEVLLRGAAILSGCAAGFVAGPHVISVDQAGIRMPEPSVPLPGRWPEHPVLNGGRSWIEREGDAHANDEIILERLSLALGISVERAAPLSAGRKAVEMIIDATESLDRRKIAATRLQLSPNEEFFVVAEPASKPQAVGHHATVATSAGTIRATIMRAGDRFVTPGRAGLGVNTSADSLDGSWSSALAALRLSSPTTPVVMANDVGGLTLLAHTSDARLKAHPDYLALLRVFDLGLRTVEILEAVVATDSLRAAAVRTGLHHSTIQARVGELSRVLGYEISTAVGRSRLTLALGMYRIVTNRF